MDRYYRKVVLVFAGSVIAFLSVYLFAASMSRVMTSDEQMYCTGGYLLSKGQMIYRDFSYIAQLPYHPLLLGIIYKLSGMTHYLLAGRIVSVVFDIVIIVCLFSIFRKIFGQYYFAGIFAGLAGTVIFVFNPYSSYLLGLAWNHDMVLLCIVLSFRIFLELDSIAVPATAKQINNCAKIAAIGALLTIAVWTRATTVFVIPFFIVMVIAKMRRIETETLNSAWAKAHPTKTKKLIWAFAGSVVVFSIVPVWIIVCSGRAFFVNIYTIPTLNSEMLHRLGIAYSKFYLTYRAMRNREFLFLILFAIVVWVYVFVKRQKIVFADKANALLAGMLVIAAFGIAYFPPTMWKQYLGIPVVFVIISIAYAMFYLTQINTENIRHGLTRIYTDKIAIFIFIAIAVFTAVKQKPFLKISKIWEIEKWTPMKVHKISKNIAAKAGESKPILTLTPLYAIEGGGEIYRELSAGAFAFRVGDKLTEQERKMTHTAGLGKMRKMIEKNQPGVVVIGPELTRFEKIDSKSLVPEGWERADYSGVHCFFRP